MNGYEFSDTASDTDEWEESFKTGEYLSDEEWIPESHLMPEVPENLQISPPVTLENEESCWIDDPLTSEDESDSQRSIMEASSIGVACNVIVQDDSASEAPSAEATDSKNASGSISSGATYSRVTSTEIAPSQPSSPKTVTSEFKPLPTDHHEEALADEIFKENPVNWSQIPNLIGDVWTDEILDKEEKLLEAVQDLLPENAPCNAITKDGNATAKVFSANGEDRPLEPEGGLPKEEPPLEAFEVGKGYIKERPIHRVQINPGSALNLISTMTLEELGIPPSKVSHTSVSIFGYDGSAQRPIGKIKFRLQIGDLIYEVTAYAIKTPSCYNILPGCHWIHENGVVPSTIHQCIKFVGDDSLIHRVFADKSPSKAKKSILQTLKCTRMRKRRRRRK
ncbi:hypothetical protein MRB53_013629 [Persea americana]|uniref:Uncharacterized protein n=1 Tax=Persea americana TaxID=3435 RepID=A0ACC2K955_PERAE|nr:hypothetical protein MRB53_013629 [Persea americana]